VKYTWIDVETKRYALAELCGALGVSVSGYRAWKRGGTPQRKRLTANQTLTMMRYTYNAMIEAAGQLSRRRAWLVDAAHRQELVAKLKWSTVGAVEIHIYVAFGNRFYGYACERHAVRQVHEMLTCC
jgi:hypothetical protein